MKDLHLRGKIVILGKRLDWISNFLAFTEIEGNSFILNGNKNRINFLADDFPIELISDFFSHLFLLLVEGFQVIDSGTVR